MTATDESWRHNPPKLVALALFIWTRPKGAGRVAWSRLTGRSQATQFNESRGRVDQVTWQVLTRKASHLRSAQNDAHSKPKVKQSVNYAKQIQPRFPAKIKGKRYKSTKGQLHKHRIDRPMKCQWLTRRQSDKITEITGEARRNAKTNDNKNFDGKLHNENSINQNANSPSSLQYLICGNG